MRARKLQKQPLMFTLGLWCDTSTARPTVYGFLPGPGELDLFGGILGDPSGIMFFIHITAPIDTVIR